MVQLGLGFCAYLTRLSGVMMPCSPCSLMVVSTVAHVAGGALVFAATVVLAIQARRMITVARHADQLRRPHPERPSSHEHRHTATGDSPRQVWPRWPRLRRAGQGARDHADHDDGVVRRIFCGDEVRRLADFVDGVECAGRHRPGQRRHRRHQRSDGARHRCADAAHRAASAGDRKA